MEPVAIDTVVDLTVAICAVLSYGLGAKAILDGRYQPSVYSRAIWMLFAFNNLASVLVLQNSFPVLILAGLGGFGNLVIFVLSLTRSVRRFGSTEIVTTVLLVISLLVWAVTLLPILNLSIGIVAHFFGGIPTLKKVIDDPAGEDTLFWFFFFFASALALLWVNWSDAGSYLYPLYFTVFDGIMTVLCLRRGGAKRSVA